MGSMHRVGSTSNMSNSARSRKERRLTYVLCDTYSPKVCIKGKNTVIYTFIDFKSDDLHVYGSIVQG